jgi:predicted amidohydrolase
MAKGCDLILFPEVQLTPFFPQYRAMDLPTKLGTTLEGLSITLDDPKVTQICNLCREVHTYASPNFYVNSFGKYYDMSLFIDPQGTILGTSKMVNVVQATHFYEQDYYTPSEDGFKVFDTPFGRVGIVICYDRHLPESIRACVSQGADLVIIPTANTTAENLEMFEWEIRVQAYQSRVNIAMCNRVGLEGEMHFAGQSIVVNRNGDVLLKSDDQERLIQLTFDL